MSKGRTPFLSRVSPRAPLCAVAVFVLLAGCASRRQVKNLTPLEPLADPCGRIFSNFVSRDYEPTYSTYRTFSVSPPSAVGVETGIDPMLQRQLLFFLRSAMELRGYEFVKRSETPDLWVTIHALTRYSEKYVPPGAMEQPAWHVRGRLVKEDLNLHSLGAVSADSWGSWDSRGTNPVRRREETAGKGTFYPSVVVDVLEGRTGEPLWLGSGVGASHNPDVSVSCQIVALSLLGSFPLSRHRPLGVEECRAIGAFLVVLTNDGMNYFPTVLEVLDGSRAEKAGLIFGQKLVYGIDPSIYPTVMEVFSGSRGDANGLRFGDVIKEIDGVSVRNKPLSDVLERIAGDPGTEVVFRVKRMSETLIIPVRRLAKEDPAPADR